MAITKSALDAKLELAITEIGDGNFSTAKTYLVQAEAILVGLPDYAIGNRRLEYRDQISKLLAHLDDAAANTTTSRKYTRTFAKCTRE